MSDAFGNPLKRTGAAADLAPLRRKLVTVTAILIGAVLVLAVIGVLWWWLAIVIVAFDVLSTGLALWAMGRAQRAHRDESPLSRP